MGNFPVLFRQFPFGQLFALKGAWKVDPAAKDA
jgi:hypothetical protein